MGPAFVFGGSLMQGLDTRHLPITLGHVQVIHDSDSMPMDFEGPESRQDDADPPIRQFCEVECG